MFSERSWWIATLTALWGLLASVTGPRAAIALAGVLMLATPLLLSVRHLGSRREISYRYEDVPPHVRRMIDDPDASVDDLMKLVAYIQSLGSQRESQ